jgi:Tol biopolymer transport system component
MRRAAGVCLLALLAAAGTRGAEAASRVLPGLAFRVLRTPHFRVYYHQGLEPQARLLAGVAESVWAEVPARLGLPAPTTTHVLLVDQDDSANGWATPLPYDTVMVTAAWPAPSEILGNAREWLRLVFTHEYTHVLLLHQSRGYARAVKWIFGRVPLAFPNLFLPGWSIEGLATFSESRFTGEGRLNAGDSFTIVTERVRRSGPERMDQVTGGQVEWPAGLGPYLYGGFFAEYLAARFGDEKLGELGRRTAGRLPYLASGAYRPVFGQGLGELWTEYQEALGAGAGASPAGTDAATRRQLTREGYYVSTPRFAADGRTIVYGRRNADDFPAVAVHRIGTDERAPVEPSRGRRLAVRYGGEQLSVHGRLVFFDRADYEVNVAWRSDLYAADIESGRVQRLTHGARLVAPDVSPDGRLLACINVAGGGRRLEVYRVDGTTIGEIRLTLVGPLGDPGALFGSPRWSPDGARLAVEHRRAGGPSEIVVFDTGSRQARVIVAGGRERNLTPAWAPGGRTVLFSSDRVGRSFQIYAADAESGEVTPVLAAAGGAQWPEVSPDGRRLVYVGCTPAGYDLFETAYPLAQASVPAASASPAAPVDQQVASSTDQRAGRSPSARYRPFFTLLPRSWQPAADYSDSRLRLGLSTGGADLLGRQAFGVGALWRVHAGSDALYGPHRARPDWNAFYVYDRWRPSMFVVASDETTFHPQSVAGVPQADAELRERKVAVGTSVPVAGVRRSQVFRAAFDIEHDTLRTVLGDLTFDRNAFQAGWAFDSARQFGYSISPEQGIAAGVTSEQVRAAFGADGDADAFSAEVRSYARVGPGHSVLAARVAAGIATGDARVARRFYLGGPQAGGLIDFGHEALSLLRGFDDQAFAATHVGGANVEYRFPVWRIERGRGNWPLFLRTLHGAVFADVGQVWDDGFSWADYKSSVGAELSVDIVLGFGAPFTVSTGAAKTFQGGHPFGSGAYVRVGRAF